MCARPVYLSESVCVCVCARALFDLCVFCLVAFIFKKLVQLFFNEVRVHFDAIQLDF